MIHACLLATCLMAQAPPASGNMSTQVAQFVRQLDANEKSQRDAAEQGLVELGPAVLDVLPDSDAVTSAEMRLRLKRIRSQLELAAARSTSRASTITLGGTGLSLEDVIKAVTEQTGNKIVDYRSQFGEPQRAVKLNLALNKVPFWQGIDQILDSGGLTIYNFGSENALALVSRPLSQVPRFDAANYVGAFRLAVTDVSSHVNLREPGRRKLQLNIEVAWEPRLKPVILTLDGSRLAGRDDIGKALKLEAAGRQIELNINSGATVVELPIELELPPREARKIASLSGVLEAVLPGRVEEFRFDELAAAKKVQQRRGGVEVTLDEARKNQSLWEMRVRVSFADAGQALESHRAWVFNNEAWVETPQGEKLEFSGMETTMQTDREVGVAYLFDVPGGLDGCKFVYRTPSAILKTPIAFELRDLELP
ncbi:MAG TPA: hypothetical protein VHV77_00210 [Pirellulales bacterium]|nr:hypothetical protein [Pirellulales bacterium]